MGEPKVTRTDRKADEMAAKKTAKAGKAPGVIYVPVGPLNQTGTACEDVADAWAEADECSDGEGTRWVIAEYRLNRTLEVP